MAALTMDQLLGAEALLHRASRTGLDYTLKPDLLRAVDHAARLVLSAPEDDTPTEDETTRHLEALLYPMAMRDDYCYAAQRMLAAALAEHAHDMGYDHAHYGLGSKHLGTLLDRRVQLFHHTIHTYVHDAYRDSGWPVLQRCTTGDRVVVLGLTSMMLHWSVAGKLVDLNKMDFPGGDS